MNIIPMDFKIRRIAIHWAIGYYGADIRENPAGSNRGFFIEYFQEQGGGQKGYSWCMYFIRHLFEDAHSVYGLDCPLLKSGQCYAVWKDAIQNPDLRIITTDEILNGIRIPHGSIIIRYNSESDKRGHVGLVWNHIRAAGTERKNDTIRTIEGNKSDRIDTRDASLEYWLNKGLRGAITGKDSVNYI